MEMLSYLTSFKNDRFLVNIDTEVIKARIENFSLLEDEVIHLLIDDSFFKNRKEIIVLTNKRIVWTTNNSSLTIDNNSSIIIKSGPNELYLSDLENCSVYINKFSNYHMLNIINDNIVITLRIKYVDNKESLKILFVNYLTSYVSSFCIENQKNNKIYKKVCKSIKKSNRNIVPYILNIFSILLVTIVILQRLYSINITIENNIENMLLLALVFKLFSIFINRNRSIISNMIVYFVFYIMFFKELNFDTMEKVLSEISFIIFSIVFYNINLDKIIKFALISVALFVTFSKIFERYVINFV
ncbi:hypothetical protein EXM22_04625 [Oceanispirochaeta crateris]|uniref:Uncharacterized protein n=1 Tax=Oceanispirochaeta crateris TaxID=2518645 RepID=A0A5C1QL96_9SPIO|nr:hypothetical protein [Oceanispirochaeta crateris]QEN07306.1 hypothetical protein EXM22_04625 [Oceanispirochaeta crateris]